MQLSNTSYRHEQWLPLVLQAMSLPQQRCKKKAQETRSCHFFGTLKMQHHTDYWSMGYRHTESVDLMARNCTRRWSKEKKRRRSATVAGIWRRANQKNWQEMCKKWQPFLLSFLLCILTFLYHLPLFLPIVYRRLAVLFPAAHGFAQTRSLAFPGARGGGLCTIFCGFENVKAAERRVSHRLRAPQQRKKGRKSRAGSVFFCFLLTSPALLSFL